MWFQLSQRKLCYWEYVTDQLLQKPSLVTGKTDTISRGRQHNNGLWFSQTQPFHVHIYSAFFDRRQTLRSQPQVAVIGVIDRRLSQRGHLWCHVWYNMIDDAMVLRADLKPAGAGKLMADGSELVEHIITCPVTTDQCVPISVALAWGLSESEMTAFRVPVELAQNKSHQHTLAICVSASFGRKDNRQLIEWLEMQQILGAQLVVIYNHSVSQSVGNILLKYAEADVSRIRVELRQTHAFMSEVDVLLHMSPVINDCMYRFSDEFRYFAVIDLDEVIVPRHVYTISTLIESLAIKNTMPVAMFIFRNAYFFLDIPVDDLQSPSRANAALSTYLTHRRRLPVSPPSYSIKSIVNSQACIAMHNHYCWTYAADALSHWTLQLDVPPSDGLLHHYKRCHLDSYLKQPGHCKHVMAATVVDNVVIKYSTSLADRLYMRCILFNVTAVS